MTVALRVKKVQTSDRVLQQMQDAVEDLARQVGVKIQAALDGAVPVRTIICVRTDIKGDAIALPDVGTWVPMDGRKIVDTDSPLNGVTLEDWNGEGRFLRGGDVAGVLQAADTKVPAHAHAAGTLAGTTHVTTRFASASGGVAKTLTAVTRDTTHTIGTSDVDGEVVATTTISGSTANDGGSGAETRPINGSVQFFIRIK